MLLFSVFQVDLFYVAQRFVFRSIKWFVGFMLITVICAFPHLPLSPNTHRCCLPASVFHLLSATHVRNWVVDPSRQPDRIQIQLKILNIWQQLSSVWTRPPNTPGGHQRPNSSSVLTHRSMSMSYLGTVKQYDRRRSRALVWFGHRPQIITPVLILSTTAPPRRYNSSTCSFYFF